MYERNFFFNIIQVDDHWGVSHIDDRILSSLMKGFNYLIYYFIPNLQKI